MEVSLGLKRFHDFARDEAAIAREAALDGFYVLRTSVPAKDSTPATVLAYKSLALVERAFRSLKSIDLEVRPVHHRLAGRVRAHVFLCMLAYYVAWRMRRKLAPLLFEEDHDRKGSGSIQGFAGRPRGSLARRPRQGARP